MLSCYSEPKVAGVMDFVTAWYCKSARYVNGTPIKAAFVSTNSLVQGEQVGILWRELLSQGQLFITFAHRTFKWRNEARGNAAVYCVIIGFSSLKPSTCRIFDYPTITSDPVEFSAKEINAYLVDAPWVLLPNRSKNPFGMPDMKYGNKPTDGGHLLFTDEEKNEFLKAEPRAEELIKPFLSGREFLNGQSRWVLWLVDVPPQTIRSLPKVRERVEAVDKFRKASKAASTRNYPYPSLFRQVTQPESDFLLIPRTTSENRKYIPFGFFTKDHIVSDTCQALPDATLYHFGVLSSEMHNVWVKSVCGRLKSDLRYSKDIVYNNFPWPASVSSKQIKNIESKAKEVLAARENHGGSSLSDLYDPLFMPPDLKKAHDELDKAVDLAYGKKSFKSDADRAAFLFATYQNETSLFIDHKK